MLTAHDLIEAAKAGASIPSNYRLARVLGVTDNTVANWRHGRTAPDDQTALKLAEMAGLDPAEVLPAMYAIRTTDPTLRGIWKRLADRMHDGRTAALTVILSVLFLGGLHEDSRAGTRTYVPESIAVASFTSYTLARLATLARTCVQRIRQALRPLMPLPALA